MISSMLTILLCSADLELPLLTHVLMSAPAENIVAAAACFLCIMYTSKSA